MPTLTAKVTMIRELHEDDTVVECELDDHAQAMLADWAIIYSDNVVDDNDRAALQDVRRRTERVAELAKKSLAANRRITGLYCELAAEQRQGALKRSAGKRLAIVPPAADIPDMVA